jgi:hypothetical protein
MERFPAAYLDQQAMEIRLLCDHGKELVAERTGVQSRLRWHALALCHKSPDPAPARRRAPVAPERGLATRSARAPGAA